MQTFKVGDWVVSAKYGIGIVESITNIEYPIQVKHFPGRDVYNNEELALWQPQPGELVILKDKNGIISVIKYNGEPNVYPFIGEITWLHKKD